MSRESVSGIWKNEKDGEFDVISDIAIPVEEVILQIQEKGSTRKENLGTSCFKAISEA